MNIRNIYVAINKWFGLTGIWVTVFWTSVGGVLIYILGFVLGKLASNVIPFLR